MGSELQVKYQALAQEYAKLRAQVDVLKKAVKDEQRKRKEVEELSREKDVALRKHVQENESLNFRNQQLTKRVTLLQGELGSPGKKRKKKEGAEGPSAGVREVQAEELAAKIQENEKLHMKVIEVTQRHDRMAKQFKEKISRLEQQVATHDAAVLELSREHTAQQESLMAEKALLKSSIEKLSQEITEANEAAARNAPDSSQTDGGGPRMSYFRDDFIPEYNALNLGTVDRKIQSDMHFALTRALDIVSKFATQMSTFHSYLEQRCKLYPLDTTKGLQMTPINRKLCELLHKSSSLTRPLLTHLITFTNSLQKSWTGDSSSLVDLRETHSSFTAYMANTTAYLLISLDDECRESVCGPQLTETNCLLSGSLLQLSQVINSINDYIILTTTGEMAESSKANRLFLIDRFQQCSADLQAALVEVSTQFTSKVTQEYQLPTSSQKLKTTNECIVSSLASLCSVSQEILEFMAGNTDIFTMALPQAMPNSSDKISSTAPTLQRLRQQASSYVKMLKRDTCPLVPYTLAVYSAKSMSDSSESRDVLLRQTTAMHERLSRVEQEKEQLFLDYQLLKVKYEKEQKKVQALEVERLGNLSPSPIRTSTTLSSSKTSLLSNPPNQTLSVSLGSLNALPMEQSEETMREELIRSHFTARITELSGQLQDMEGKATHYYTQCVAVLKQLLHNNKLKTEHAHDFESAQETIQQLQDQLSTTASNYESQLSTMSDHLCEMRDKMLQQEEEMEALRRGGKPKKWGRKASQI